MLAFDHLVVYADSIDNKKQEFSSHHHLVTVKGGQHILWGTYNYLAFMKNNSYIEWLGIRDVEKARASDNPLIQRTAEASQNGREGPIQFALRTNRMDELIEYYDQHGIAYKGPFPGSRRRPDRSLLEWRMLFPLVDGGISVLPFLIEWSGDGNRPNNVNDINSISFTRVRLGVKDLDWDMDRFRKAYDLGEPRYIDDNNGGKYEWALENGVLELGLVRDVRLEAQFGEIVLG